MHNFLITGGADTHYEARCGGVRVLHYLANLLVLNGEQVATTFPCNRFFPVVPYIEQSKYVDSDTIVVYPDSMASNHLGASKIVRYLLYFSPYLIPATELPIIYSKIYFDQVASKCAKKPSLNQIVQLPSLEPGLCYPERKTIGSVFFQGKGSFEPPEGAVIIRRFVQSRGQAMWMLRKAHNFYTTDIHSVMPLEAQLCGCSVFVKRDGEWVKEPPLSSEGWIMDPDLDRPKAVKFASLCYEFFKS